MFLGELLELSCNVDIVGRVLFDLEAKSVNQRCCGT